MDLRFALRSLWSQKTISLLVIACLALVVAGNTGVFAIVRSYILKPFPYPESHRLAMVWERNEKTTVSSNVSIPSFLAYQERNQSFSALTAIGSDSVNLTGDGPPELLTAEFVTADFFPMLGTAPAQGRLLTAVDSEAGAEAVVVLTDGFWQRRFGGRSDIVGSDVLLDKKPTRVVGILPADFEYINWNVDIYVPFTLDRNDVDFANRRVDHLLGRLAPGVDDVRAAEDLGEISRDLQLRDPEANEDQVAVVRLLKDQVPGPTDVQLFSMIQGAGLFVLLIACANIANLLLARSQARQRELAMRTALGAGKLRILRQLLTESVTLALVGGLAGIALGFGVVRYLRSALAGGLPQTILPEVDTMVLLFSLAISASAGLFFGLVPAFQSLGGQLTGALREGGGRGAVGGRRLLAKTFVVAEVALALALLCGAGILLHSFLDVQYGDQGFDSEGVVTFSLSLPADDYPEEQDRVALHERLLTQLQAIPGIDSATSATGVPRSRNIPIGQVEIIGREVEEGAPAPRTTWLSVDAQHPEVLGLTLLQGRALAVTDAAEAQKVALVDDNFTRRFFGDGDAVGQRIEIQGAEREIVGVVSSMRNRRIGSIDGPSDAVYLPFSQNPGRRVAYLLRLRSGDLSTVADSIRQAVWSLDPNLPVGGLMTLDDSIALSLTGLDIFTVIVGGFALFALVLAALGLYGVLAYSVSQRRREIGVRMAMGAGRGSVLLMILRQGLGLTALGLLIGTPMAWAIRRFLDASLAELAASPALLVPSIVATLIVVATVASLLPARRASGVEPTKALRAD